MLESKEYSLEEPLELVVDRPVYPFDTDQDFNFRNLQKLESLLSRDLTFNNIRGAARLSPAEETMVEYFEAEGYEFPLGSARLAHQFDTGARLIAEVPLRLGLPNFGIYNPSQFAYLSQFYGELKVGAITYIFPCNGNSRLDLMMGDFQRGFEYALLNTLWQADGSRTSANILLPMDREKVRTIEVTLRKYRDARADEPLPLAPNTLVRV